MSKVRGISADIQAPRTKLLYLIYSAPHSRIKAVPGVKSQVCAALGYKSDGHFHHDLGSHGTSSRSFSIIGVKEPPSIQWFWMPDVLKVMKLVDYAQSHIPDSRGSIRPRGVSVDDGYGDSFLILEVPKCR